MTMNEALHNKIDHDEEDNVNATIISTLIQSLSQQMPLKIQYKHIDIDNSTSPLYIVMLQEIERYNELLKVIHHTLDDLSKGIKGLVVISNTLEDIQISLLRKQVPIPWSFAYPSLKSLDQWCNELLLRLEQLNQWVVLIQQEKIPKTIWLGGLTFPKGLLNIIQQQSARKNGVSIDSMSWEFNILNEQDIILYQLKKVYILKILF